MQLIDNVSALLRLQELEQNSKNSCSKEEIGKLKSNLSDELMHRYEYLRKKFGKTAVVPVKNKLCYGCYITNAAQSKPIEEGVYVCEHCGRMMLDSQETPFYDIYSNEF